MEKSNHNNMLCRLSSLSLWFFYAPIILWNLQLWPWHPNISKLLSLWHNNFSCLGLQAVLLVFNRTSNSKHETTKIIRLEVGLGLTFSQKSKGNKPYPAHTLSYKSTKSITAKTEQHPLASTVQQKRATCMFKYVNKY